MAVAFNAVANVTPATGSSFNISITVPSGNPVLLVGIGLSDASATITGVSWSLGSGTAVEIKALRLSNTYGSVWAIPAPGVGAGTVSVTLSASVPYQAAAEAFTGADQTTPCPTGDAVSTSGTDVTQLVITPTNLTSNDCSFGLGVQTVADDPSGVSQNDRFKNNTTAVNLQVGDSVGTAACSANWTLSGSGGKQVAIGVRIVPQDATNDVLIRFGSMLATSGSGLVMAAFAAAGGGAAVLGGGAYFQRRKRLDELCNIEDW